MDLGLTGRRALVLASSKGLGAAIAGRLAAEGARVTITGRSADQLAVTAGSIKAATGAEVSTVVADLGAEGGVDAIVGGALSALGGVDILVNNTGGPAPGLASTVAPDAWQREFGQMAAPVFEITRRLLPDMRERRWGRILTVASSGVLQPIPNLPVSNALRASIVSWSKTLSMEVAAEGVTVNVILPGRIATDRTRQLDAAAAARTGKTPEAVMAESVATIPAGRYGTVDEFAAVAAFLASASASYVTGSVIRVDGGLIRSV